MSAAWRTSASLRSGDLVHLFPARHNDFSSIRTVAELVPGDNQTAILTVWEASETMLGRQRSTQAVLGDETGNIRAVWFNNPWLASQLKSGSRVMLSGRVSVFMGSPVFQGPEYEVLDGADYGVHTEDWCRCILRPRACRSEFCVRL